MLMRLVQEQKSVYLVFGICVMYTGRNPLITGGLEIIEADPNNPVYINRGLS